KTTPHTAATPRFDPLWPLRKIVLPPPPCASRAPPDPSSPTATSSTAHPAWPAAPPPTQHHSAPPSFAPARLRWLQPIEVFLNIGVPIAVCILSRIRCIVGIKFMLDLPLIRHAIPIRVLVRHAFIFGITAHLARIRDNPLFHQLPDLPDHFLR